MHMESVVQLSRHLARVWCKRLPLNCRGSSGHSVFSKPMEEQESTTAPPESKKTKEEDNEPVTVDGNGSSGDLQDEKSKVMMELEASLPPGLSKNQRKKRLKYMYRDKMKATWR